MKREVLDQLSGIGFSEVLANDPELKQLESMINDRSRMFSELVEILKIETDDKSPLAQCRMTPAKWVMLWQLGNPCVCGGTMTVHDIEQAFYLLSSKDLRKCITDLSTVSVGILSTLCVTPQAALDRIRQLRLISFRPLELIPGPARRNTPVLFDAMWLTGICGIAARESGMPADRVMNEMSLTEVCCHFVNHCMRRSKTPEAFHRMPDEQLSNRISERINTLAEQYLNVKRAQKETE